MEKAVEGITIFWINLFMMYIATILQMLSHPLHVKGKFNLENWYDSGE